MIIKKKIFFAYINYNYCANVMQIIDNHTTPTFNWYKHGSIIIDTYTVIYNLSIKVL